MALAFKLTIPKQVNVALGLRYSLELKCNLTLQHYLSQFHPKIDCRIYIMRETILEDAPWMYMGPADDPKHICQ